MVHFYMPSKNLKVKEKTKHAGWGEKEFSSLFGAETTTTIAICLPLQPFVCVGIPHVKESAHKNIVIVRCTNWKWYKTGSWRYNNIVPSSTVGESGRGVGEEDEPGSSTHSLRNILGK